MTEQNEQPGTANFAADQIGTAFAEFVVGISKAFDNIGGHYVLDAENKAVRVDVSTPDKLIAWGRFFEDLKRRTVQQDHLCGRVLVSTVFLGLDHGFDGRVALFETMIFGGEFDGEMKRYETWDEAKVCHEMIMVRVRHAEGDRGYSRSHWRKIRDHVMMADATRVIKKYRTMKNDPNIARQIALVS